MLNLAIITNYMNYISTKEALDILPANQISFLQYINEDCLECDQMKPHFIEIKERLDDENYDMNVKTINCNKFECSERDVKSFPSFILYDGLEEAHRMSGVATYNDLTKFVLDNTSIDLETFTSVKENEGVRVLYERDFYERFDGPWLILFYKRTGDYMREVFRQLAIDFSGKCHIAEISMRSAKNIAAKHNIKEFPTIVALNDGLEVSYAGGRNFDELAEFTKKVVKTTFNEITWDTLKNRESAEPVFVVMHNDISHANSYFKQKAHDYKMSIDIFRTTDSEIFKRVGFTPGDDNTSSVGLAVYKNGFFHKYPGNLDEDTELIKWIFHTHFPHLTMLTDSNYINILHGIKPIILLLSPSEQNVDKFEDVAKTINHGVPFTNYLFAYLDTHKFDDFMPTILPSLDVPTIVLYHPEDKKFYHQKVDMTNSKTMFDGILNFIEKYTENKLKPLGKQQKSHFKFYAFILLLAALVCSVSVYKYKCLKKGEFSKYQI